MTQVAIDPIGQAGLTFFSRTTAAISHELKNALAIIKENAGLIEDYLLMAEKGMPIDPQKFKRVSTRIGAQTARADELIKNMNRFAHSADHHSATADLNELAELFVTLSQRETAMRQATLALTKETSPVMVNTSPFLLLTILGRTLTFCLESVSAQDTVTVRVAGSNQGSTIRFEQLYNLNALSDKQFPGEQEILLLNTLDITFNIDLSQGIILFTLE